MKELWNQNTEIDFFMSSLKIATPEQLFYITKDGKYYAYWPKSYKGTKSTLQSRNSFIGSYTERWMTRLYQDLANRNNSYALQGVVCDELGLSKKSPADVAICKRNSIIQRPEDILLIIEVKMSIVWNWQYFINENKIECIGNYNTHKGNPGLLRSDTMLKAIGKSINIRVSSRLGSKIPIIILGNTPITESYIDKVDNLKTMGIIQGFWSINPNPLGENKYSLKNTPKNGFIKFDEYDNFLDLSENLLMHEMQFFSSMIGKKELGKIIEIANSETTYENKAAKFLELINS